MLCYIIISIALFHAIYCVIIACRHFIGYNPKSPGCYARFRAWLVRFVTRHVLDDKPDEHEDHASTRYDQSR